MSFVLDETSAALKRAGGGRKLEIQIKTLNKIRDLAFKHEGEEVIHPLCSVS